VQSYKRFQYFLIFFCICKKSSNILVF
jgi:hypothetical protein